MDQITQDAAQEVMAKAATYGGGTAAVVGWFTVTEWCAIGGFICAIIGLGFQVYFGIQKHRRDQEYHERRMNDG